MREAAGPIVTIPIRNLYYLFSYAWSRFPEGGGGAEVGVDRCPDLPNLFARILINSANRLLRRGLDRGYCEFVEETRAPRGRMLLGEIVKRQSLLRGAVVCAFDELTPNVLHNRIIKATALSLARARGVTRDHAHELRLVGQRMEGVEDIRLTSDCFRRVQLSRNTGQYLSTLKLCEFVFRALLPDEHGDGARFAEILKDEVTMSTVFEDFLRNFYAHEQQAFTVRAEAWPWDGYSLEPGGEAFLPMLMTDITLRSRTRSIVMDAKFYKEALVERSGVFKVRSTHLYQLLAYMEHAALRAPHLPCDGALIYPAVGDPIALRYRLRGHEVVVRSVDLTRPWQAIHDELLAIPGEFGAMAANSAAAA